MTTKYDLIVVGAGPGGSSAAITAAKKGLKVLLLERARTPGEKNMSGSSLWRNISEEIFPGFQKQGFDKDLGRFSGIGISYQLDNDEKRYGVMAAPGADVMRNMLLVYRNETDKWCAEQAVKAGAELKTALATDLLWDDQDTGSRRVKGVVTDVGNFEAPATIDASGMHSILARRAGLAKFGQDKVMVAVKYIYKLDPKTLRERLNLYQDSDGLDVDDWGNEPVFFGNNPEFFAAHVGFAANLGLVTVTVYQTLKEMVQARVNIHQRMQWYLNEKSIQRIVAGGKIIQMNFHALSSFDTVGYVHKSFLPGFFLVGDAGGFANPADSWGANVAQYQGRLAAEVCAEMKAKKDYSEAMFAKYEEGWRNSFVGEDDVHDMSRFFREGSFDKLWAAIDSAASFAIAGKFENMSYPALMMGAMPRMLGALPAILEMGNMMKGTAEAAGKQAGGIMKLLGMGSNQ